MCGRYTLTDADPARIRSRFALDESARLEESPRYNIAPTDPVLAIRRTADGTREPGRLRWGLVPGRWSAGPGPPLINARAETIARQPAFAESFRERRCLIPADGFYEWRGDGERKTPVWISRRDRELFAFAGIWAALSGREGATELASCAIVTCEPNDLLRPIHDRMPVILHREREAAWLDPRTTDDRLTALFEPAPSDLLALRDVGDFVSHVRDDGPHLIEPRAAQPQLF